MRKAFAIATILIFVMSGCKKNVDGGGSETTTNPDPGKSLLIFPAQNAACTTGTVISNTQSLITFNWKAADNTDSYELDIKNLLTSAIINIIATTNQAQVTLLKNTPYSWSIISRSAKTSNTTSSDVWKFYNAGDGVTYYAPFPAVITSPTFNQSVTAVNNTVNINWSGSSVDNDIVGYDVYLSTGFNPALLKTNVTDMFLNDVPVTIGNTYYLKIVTKDVQGNTSDSGISQFTVK